MKLDTISPPEGAEARAWQVVRAAYGERTPAHGERKAWRPVLVLAAAAVVAGAVASPPGQAVLDSIREVVGIERAQPALVSLPAPDPLLVESADGVWVVQADGSKRRLGDWREASWSPFGRFVVVARANELAALEPGHPFASRGGRATGSTRGSRISAAPRCGWWQATARTIACSGGTWPR